MSVIDLILSQPSAITAVLVVVGAVISTVVPIVTREVYRIRSRIDELETRTTRHSRTLYGDADDPTHSGLAQELDEIKTTLNGMEQQMETITRAIESNPNTKDKQNRDE